MELCDGPIDASRVLVTLEAVMFNVVDKFNEEHAYKCVDNLEVNSL